MCCVWPQLFDTVAAMYANVFPMTQITFANPII